jgi:hypothetical protein
MWDAENPAERMAGETRRAHGALSLYLAMGPARSLQKLAEYPRDTPVGLLPINSLKKWCRRYAWVERARAFDDQAARALAAAYEARRAEIMEHGLALTHERVDKLYRRFDELEKLMQEPDNVLCPDFKSIREGDEFVKIRTVRFNQALFDTWRGILGDIAAEVGGRIRRAELTGKDGGPIRTAESHVNLAALTNEELAELERLTEKAANDIAGGVAG